MAPHPRPLPAGERGRVRGEGLNGKEIVKRFRWILV